jgi:hypothetical protein
LESKADKTGTLEIAKQSMLKLEKLDTEFKSHHFDLIDTIEDESVLKEEEVVLEQHEDNVASLTLKLQHLITACGLPAVATERKVALRRLQRLKKLLASAETTLGESESLDTCFLRQHEEQLVEFKREIAEVRTVVFTLDLDDGDALNVLMEQVKDAIFSCSLKVKKLLQSSGSGISSGEGVKLPRLEIPTFDGDILQWRSFWEQFDISVHSRSNLSKAEKLVYLQNAVKGGSAKGVIEGLSRSGDCYSEAIECLQSRYNHPRLIHQTHVKMILEAPPLKDGSGRELRKLHDVVLQHLRALRTMKCEPSGPFITSVLELKLDTNTLFEWQKHSQDSSDVPHFDQLL